MASLKTVHSDILNAIKTKLTELTALKSITIGELTTLPPDKFPACYIIPSRDEEADENVAEIMHRFRTKIVVIERDASPTQGAADMIDLCGDVHDKLLADRTLGGKCEILYFVDRNFDYMLGKDYSLFWAIIAVEPWKAI